MTAHIAQFSVFTGPTFHTEVEYIIKDIVEGLWMIVAVPSLSNLGGCKMYRGINNIVKDMTYAVNTFIKNSHVTASKLPGTFQQNIYWRRIFVSKFKTFFQG